MRVRGDRLSSVPRAETTRISDSRRLVTALQSTQSVSVHDGRRNGAELLRRAAADRRWGFRSEHSETEYQILRHLRAHRSWAVRFGADL